MFGTGRFSHQGLQSPRVSRKSPQLGLWDCSSNPNPIPPLFDFFPEAKAMVKEYALKQLDCFGVEMMWDELITAIIPGLLEQAHNDNVDPDSLHYNILMNYHAKKPSYSTVWRWVCYLGFNYST